jgi:hypothetical protein
MHDRLEFPTPKGFQLADLEVVDRPARAPVRVMHPDPIFRVTLNPENTIGPGCYDWRFVSRAKASSR